MARGGKRPGAGRKKASAPKASPTSKRKIPARKPAPKAHPITGKTIRAASIRYTDEIGSAICERLASGESIRSICSTPGMPAMGTVFRWLARDPDFREQYAHSREIQAEFMAEQILEIADDGTNDWMTRAGRDGESVRVVDHEHIQRSKLRVDSRKWLMSKLAPKKYGDRIAQEVSGANGGPIQIVLDALDTKV